MHRPAPCHLAYSHLQSIRRERLASERWLQLLLHPSLLQLLVLLVVWLLLLLRLLRQAAEEVC
jgi:hypothetical protein